MMSVCTSSPRTFALAGESSTARRSIFSAVGQSLRSTAQKPASNRISSADGETNTTPSRRARGSRESRSSEGSVCSASSIDSATEGRARASRSQSATARSIAGWRLAQGVSAGLRSVVAGRWLPGIGVGGSPRRRTVAAVTARWSLGRWLAAQVLKAATFSLASSSPETVQPGRARNASTYSPMKPASRTSTS